MTPEVIALIAERKIQEAIEEGKFDNLPGKGKPLVFTDDPMTPPHLRIGNHILKNAGVLPDWMQVQKDIVLERQAVVASFDRLLGEQEKWRAWLSRVPPDHPLRQEFASWHTKARAAYLRRLKDVNTSILKFCMLAPSTAQPYAPYKIAEEMEAFDAAFPVPQAPVLPAPEPPREEGDMRKRARDRYRMLTR